MTGTDTEKLMATTFFLKQERDIKCHLLAKAWLDEPGVFMVLSKIVLDKPISDGGLPTELIEDISMNPHNYIL